MPDSPVASDAPWQATLRRRQSAWRAARGLAAGSHRGRPLGSRLTPADGAAGANFLTPTVHARVEAELAANARARGAAKRVLEPDRLRENLLSSQPLCFNLFAELDADRDLATAALGRVFPGLGRVERIEFEWSPGRGDPAYLGNKSAFDVAVFHSLPEGRRGVLGIEVKYHEDLKAKAGALGPRACQLAAGLGADPADRAWQRAPLNQLLLDHLLARSLTAHPARPHGTGSSCLLFPDENPACHAAVAAYRARLGDPPGFTALTLEALVAALEATTPAAWVGALRARYLVP